MTVDEMLLIKNAPAKIRKVGVIAGMLLVGAYCFDWFFGESNESDIRTRNALAGS